MLKVDFLEVSMGFNVNGRPFAFEYATKGSEVIDVVAKTLGSNKSNSLIVGNEIVPVEDVRNRTIPANTPIYWPTTDIEQGK
jgi:hypothetical protein